MDAEMTEASELVAMKVRLLNELLTAITVNPDRIVMWEVESVYPLTFHTLRFSLSPEATKRVFPDWRLDDDSP